ncbi:chemotaxis-specific protein-glutamate methyltransferase CheB [bacterium]|nr:MAG: chemotaxis-specific protein-glutamate methyltransferase CheB [bacterium]
MIKVLIVDDSQVTRELLKYILSSDSEIQIIGTASNGLEAIEFVEKQLPDVITMDINMPKMDGIEAIRKIMSSNPVPIIIVSSSLNPNDVKDSYKAMEAGALLIVSKPGGSTTPDYLNMSKNLIDSVKLMSEIKVVKRWSKRNPDNIFVNNHNKELARDNKEKIKIVVIGVSTGGPPVLQTILSSLPENFSLPILIVQHISEGFLPGLVQWLNETSKLKVSIAMKDEIAKPGHVYLAPNKFQMSVDRSGKINLTNDKPENSTIPSVSYLFRSVAKEYGSRAMGILLTGMGKDGANELLLMKESGAITIAQNKESSTIFGMPGEAVKINAAKYIISPEKIVDILSSFVDNK